MANNFYNKQIETITQPTSGNGVLPKKGEPQKSDLPMRVANWPGLPGSAQKRDRANGIQEEKIYAQAIGLRGGKDTDTY